jgi:hypothetical protein
MTKPQNRGNEDPEWTKRKPGGQQHQNPPNKTSTDNPERNPRDPKGSRREQIISSIRNHVGC